MSHTLVIPDWLAAALLDTAKQPLETAAVLLAHPVPLPNGSIRLLGHAVRWVPPEAYARREGDSLTITSAGYVPALGEAESTRSTPLFLHTHPGEGASPRPSPHDDKVDEQLRDVFRLRADSDIYGSIVVGTLSDHLTFTGRLYQGDSPEALERLWVVGDSWQLLHSYGRTAGTPTPKFDRQVRAFGGGIQRILGDLEVAVVGCGGTGSCVAEQLVRLGVRSFHLFDPDVLSESNLSRVYGSFSDDVGNLKTENLAAHLAHIAPDVRITCHPAMITMEATARELAAADVVFGCSDDNAGRLVLSRLATYLMTPVIDCGVLLSSTDTRELQGIDGRVTVLAPGLACLVCRGRIDTQRAATELLTPDERRRRQDEGYAPALQGAEPAVVSFTSLVASLATSELLERLIHYGPDPRPSEILVRAHDRELSTNLGQPRSRHYCHPESHKIGLGITDPFLEQTWPDA